MHEAFEQKTVERRMGDEEDDGLLEDENARPPKHSILRAGLIHVAVYVFLLLVIVVQAALLLSWRTELAEHPPRMSRLGLDLKRDHRLTSGLLNRFWQGDNLTGPNEAWNNINSGHGIISLDPAFATQQGYPDTMRHPHDPTEVVYAIESYHMIHCIQRLRMDYLLIRDGKQPTKPLEHAMHCFDALRQSVMCQANDELLVITGHGHNNGFNQTRQCRSWDALRDCATDNTACYWDDELPEGHESRWNMCDDGTDGLPIGNLLD